MSLLKNAPSFSIAQAKTLAKSLYGITAVAKHLASERDQNFLLTNETGDKFVLKIANSLEQLSLLEAQNQAMTHLQSHLDFCPQVLAARLGESVLQIESEMGATYLVRLVTYISGAPLATVTHSPQLLFDLGKKLGLLTRALSDFDHPAFHRHFHWDLANGLKVIDEHARLVVDADLREQIHRCIRVFERNAATRLETVPRSVIHGDANDYNVIVENQEVVGLIDFGDMIHSYTVAELAVAIAYVMLEKVDPLTCAQAVVSGYMSEWRLKEDELEAVWSLTLLRLCLSVCLAAEQRQQRPDNEYLDISQRSIRNSLPRLLEIDSRVATDVFCSLMR